ncbi:MAG: copper-translocating P-type ATPase [Candidatus Pacebacteria bacterium]|nr:copper-translocating P-type ATPase [Candidatus Paceibacterota bacterium]
MKKEILKISGMTCASCAANIENALGKKEGIIEANVNIASEKASLKFNSEKISISQIKKTIEDIGYGVKENIAEEKNEENIEIIKLKKRLFVSLIVGLPLIYIVMGKMIGLPMPKISEINNIIIQLILSTIVIAANFSLWKSGAQSLIKFMPNMDSLIFIGTASAYFYSIAISFLFLLNFQLTSLHLYFESAVFILLFITLGKYLEAITKGKTSEAIKKLAGLQPKEAIIIKNGKEIKVPILEVRVDDIILVKPGEKIPVDGIVINGYSGVDQQAITGESMPIEKKKGDTVIGATINKTGSLEFKATKVGKDTMLSHIIKTVEESMGSKAPIQLLADKVSFYFVPTVIAISIIAASIWLIFGQPPAFALSIFVAVLIVACPCALGLATPTAVMMGTGLAAKNGILIKSSKALEIAQKIDMIVFDKTGTLTKGEPVVTNVVGIKESKSKIIQIASSIEKHSEHPLAQAIVKNAEKNNLKFYEINNFQAIPGKGVTCRIENKNILLGTRKLLIDNKISIDNIEEEMKKLEDQGKTAMILAQDREVIGIIAVADTLKENSIEAIGVLKKMGKKIAIITGDNKRIGEAIARELDIDFVLAEVLPQEKSDEIKKLQKKGFSIAMVGDGINDAPALAQADLGIALGSGTDIAMETGEIVLINNDLRNVVTAIDLSSYTMKKIKQNLFWAFFYNSTGIPIAAGILYPITGWLLNPSFAAAAMAFSSVSVVSNSLLMKRYRPRIEKK